MSTFLDMLIITPEHKKNSSHLPEDEHNTTDDDPQDDDDSDNDTDVQTDVSSCGYKKVLKTSL